LAAGSLIIVTKSVRLSQVNVAQNILRTRSNLGSPCTTQRLWCLSGVPYYILSMLTFSLLNIVFVTLAEALPHYVRKIYNDLPIINQQE
jgi:hypothetical protein